jgi:type I restriction enzyme R subunit
MRPLKYKIARLVANLQSQFSFSTKPLLLPKVWCDTQSFSQRQCVRKDKTLRDRFQLTKDGTSFYVCFFNTETTVKSIFKLLIKSVWKEATSRYDVILLVNGLPLVQIELKRSDIEIKAFNQINSCQNHSFWAITACFNTYNCLWSSMA